MSTIRLKSSDGVIFDTDPKAMKCSHLITQMLVDCGIEPGSETCVPLPNVKAFTLGKFIEWANHHKDDVPPKDPNDKNYDDLEEWDENFLKVDQASLIELIMAANYLDVRDLFEMACKTTADLIAGKNTEEIRETFHIKNDFTRSNEKGMGKEIVFANEKSDNS
ncbi:S-phase kinase-associated protein 1-like [Bradysia coprophila]|uniref:S-phase kinase-associated protein 1-like n=1 Tax=Bradysia coprophila TaxID=38358 RepID=UPI00187D92FA|nr:S-phase kinase-associated protein 1-like [Bradysia coprophila]